MALNHACNCCDQPPSPDPFIEYRSAEDSCETCGYGTFDFEDATPEDLAKCYSTITGTYVFVSHAESEIGGTSRVIDVTVEETLVHKSEVTEAGICESGMFSGAHERIFTEVRTDLETDDIVVDVREETITEAGDDGVYSGTITYTDSVTPENNSSEASTEEVNGVILAPDSTWSHSESSYTKIETTSETTTTRTVTLSGLVTLCEPTSFPSFPEWEREITEESPELGIGQGYSQTAIRGAGGCGMEISITRMQWRIYHLPPGTCYLKVWIGTINNPSGGSPSAPSITTYEWVGTGNPCLPSTTDPADADSQIITGTVTTVEAPGVEGYKSVIILKWSFVQGYEPDIEDEENPQPNGFPDPTWEPAAP